VFAENLTSEMTYRLTGMLNLAPDEVPCSGCRVEGGCRLQFSDCATLACINAKGHTFCFECQEFPCGMLLPSSDRAGRLLPHNLKVFNLCRIKAVGAQEWLATEAKPNREKYFRGTLEIGQGPVLDP
jgi:hypothetical protein